ncbi:MAG: ribosome small subunit-dependent GTPase A [Candidatus Sericytochromatia bacterium]
MNAFTSHEFSSHEVSADSSAWADSLAPWGWTPFFSAAFAEHAGTGLMPARLLSEHPGLFRFVTAGGEGLAELSGRLRHQALSREELPAVGDWVALNWRPDMDKARIEAVLPRRSVFARKETGGRSQAQIVAANVDTVLLVSALNQDLNVRRIERYLTLAWESGARPVIVLSKADLASQAEALRAEVEAVAIGTEILTLSALTGTGLDALGPYLAPGQTLALLGSSGVGKSTLVNALAGHQLQRVQAIREDDARGRHTTTHRELFRLPSGALLLDTPGMRELQLWSAGDGLDASFGDILELAAQCRFRNCAHAGESGCAIVPALENGGLDPLRWQNYLKLKREEAWVERRQDAAKAANTKRRWKQIHVQARQHMKEKYK